MIEDPKIQTEVFPETFDKSKLRTLSSLEDTPDVIVLHVAGNDLGAYEIGDLRYFLRAQLRYIKR
jgi:tRNA threonylcarbamoyladenosine modification (KEOPS) complex  Pcc1 subunit